MNKIDENFTKRAEGCRLHVYRDTRGIRTIGIGHSLDTGDNSHIVQLGLSPTDLKLGNISLTQEQADDLFELDMEGMMPALRRLVPQLDLMPKVVQLILSDLIFNMGPHTLATFRNTLKSFNEGKYSEAARGLRNSLWYTQVGDRSKAIVQALRALPDGLTVLDCGLTGPVAPNPEPDCNPLNRVNEKGYNLWTILTSILTKLGK